MRVRHLPNLICLARIALIWPILAALVNANYDFALLLFAVAAVSDGLDGFLAKRFGWESELGKILDPLADKLLLISVFVMATSLALVPWWLALTAVTRDLMIILGAIVLRIRVGPLEGRPSVISKINTLLQLTYLLGVITHAAGYGPPQGFLAGLAVVAVVTTLLSWVNYAMDFARALRGAAAKAR
jgi:cardiolipin synthase (CMP-forming)